MSAPSGYGRGGRGAALVLALQTPMRKPGDPTPPAVPAQASLPARPAFGRGALIAQLTKSPLPGASTPAPQQTPQSVAPKPVHLPVGRGFGRGLLVQDQSPQPTLAPPQTQAPPIAMGRAIGRGAAFGRGFAMSPQPQPSACVQDQAPPQPPAKFTTAVQTPAPTPPAAQPQPPDATPSQTSGDKRWNRRPLYDEMSALSLSIPKEKGTVGQPVPLTANFIRLTTTNKEGLYLYAVSFEPTLDSILIRRALLRGVEEVPKPFEFDGANLFMPAKIPGDQMTVKAATREGREHAITLKMVKVLPYTALSQFFNVMFNRIMSELKMAPIRRQFFDSHHAIFIPQHKLEVWPGYVTSIKVFDGGLMCLLDTTHKVLRTDTVYSVMTDLSKSRGNFQENATRAIVGSIVLTRYNRKTYRIDDIDWGQNPKSTFETRSGSVSFEDYYRDHYGKTGLDPQQPLLIHRPSRREQREGQSEEEIICLIPELCYLTGLTDECRQDFRVMKDLASHTRISPTERQARLQQFIENVNSHSAARKILEDWGLRLDTQSIQTEGRLFPPETILFKNDRSVSAGDRADWNSAVLRNSVYEAVSLDRWVVLCVQANERDVCSFVQHIASAYKQMGCGYKPPQFITLANDRTETYLREIRNHIHPELQLVMVIFPSSRDDRYNAFKKLCCCESPVASQAINYRTIKRLDKARSVAQKVALQMNAKLGGGLWGIKIPADGIMFCGIDVYHNSAKGLASWGGFVASLNKPCTQWYSKVCQQLPGQELGDGLKVCLLGAIRAYHKYNHTPPKRIFIFRDGVGDGDLKKVVDWEVRQLQAAFPLFGEGYQPLLTMLVVQKRVNTKLYARVGNARNVRMENPGPGTVIDHTVTRKDMVDFYLVSQHVRQGTVTPTHYVVVQDDSGWPIGRLQQVSYKLAHIYYNWPGTIRTPAPCQYAHKLAYLVGENLKRDPSSDLSMRLFYL